MKKEKDVCRCKADGFFFRQKRGAEERRVEENDKKRMYTVLYDVSKYSYKQRRRDIYFHI